ncbi:50S ribosomal protein L24e [Halorhabdus amylolytica]|uniref:50S ribosomal protein L24e n=1 Tax=Halorhabdus amylolytica TaxID=2559573 RepID=UPI0010AA02F4|nr:50S ribosomal protein L24e [Halorhabdus amylolytica]
MPQTRECDYCGADIEPGTGTMFVRKNGTTIHFCSSKCEKNADLGREARDLSWTEAGGATSGESPEEASAEEVEEESDEPAETQPDEEVEAAESGDENVDADEADAEEEPADSDEEESAADEADAEETDTEEPTEADA